MAEAPSPPADPNQPDGVRPFLKKKEKDGQSEQLMKEARERFKDKYKEDLPGDLKHAKEWQLELLANIIDELKGSKPPTGDESKNAGSKDGEDGDGKEGKPSAPPAPDEAPTRVRKPQSGTPTREEFDDMDEDVERVESELAEVRSQLAQARPVLGALAHRATGGPRERIGKLEPADLNEKHLPEKNSAEELLAEVVSW